MHRVPPVRKCRLLWWPSRSYGDHATFGPLRFRVSRVNDTRGVRVQTLILWTIKDSRVLRSTEFAVIWSGSAPACWHPVAITI